jgi:hypothetical protein
MPRLVGRSWICSRWTTDAGLLQLLLKPRAPAVGIALVRLLLANGVCRRFGERCLMIPLAFISLDALFLT